MTDSEALRAFADLARLEGTVCALESAHAVAWVQGRPAHWSGDDLVLVNLSGRGDEDVALVVERWGAHR